jgi:rod shape-determining protein MreD
MVRWLISFVVVAITVIVQLTIVDRIAFPGGTGPDLVLLAVAALALAGGPLAGALIGFSAGLALDIAPPGSHLVGQDALVFCLVGYVCGLVAEVPTGDGVPEQGRTALFEIVVTAAGAVCGEALGALLGVMLSDPRVTWPAVKHVLPVAVIYDVLLAPFVLFAVAAALRLAGSPRERDGAVWSGAPARTTAPSASAIRQVNGGSTPRLRLSERAKGEGWVGGARGALAQSVGGRPAAKREPRLNLARSGSPSRGRPRAGGALGAAFATGGLGGGAAKVKFGSRRYEGILGGSWLGAMTATSGLAGSRLTSSRFGRSRMGRSLFGGSVFSRSPSALTRPAAPRSRPAALGRASFLGRSSPFGGTSSALRKAGLRRSAPRSPAGGHAPRFARGGTFTQLTAALRRSTRRRPAVHQPTLRRTTRRQPTLGAARSPGRGWLRGTSSRRSGLGRSGLGRGWRGGGAPGLGTGGLNGAARLHMPRPRVKRRRRTGGYR